MLFRSVKPFAHSVKSAATTPETNLQVRRLTTRKWEWGSIPPSSREALAWLEKEGTCTSVLLPCNFLMLTSTTQPIRRVRPTPLLLLRCVRRLHLGAAHRPPTLQIEGPTQAPKFVPVKGAVSHHEKQHMSLLTMELHGKSFQPVLALEAID